MPQTFSNTPNKETGSSSSGRTDLFLRLGRKSIGTRQLYLGQLLIQIFEGGVEPGEFMLAATKREALEESGCKIEIVPAHQTLHCTLEERKFTSYHLEDDCPPILIYNTSRLSVCVYVAKCSIVPTPHREIPALIFLPPSTLQGGLLEDILQEESILKE